MSKIKVFTVILMCIFLVALVAIGLAGCTQATGYNKQIFDTSYKFERAYVKIGDDWVDVKVKKWNDYEGEQIQLVLEDDTVLLVSDMNCILYSGTLPRK